MKTSSEIKKMVSEKYAALAHSSGKESCCSPACCESADSYSMADSYENLNGFVPEADLGLGCGLPTQHAGISAGDVVVDLGSGAGNDSFVARQLVGESGRVVGIDMTPAMIEKANANKHKLQLSNIEFILGDIENIPLNNHFADVVISNCVLNLVPEKEKAFSEMYRILKPGGHFCISDIVLKGALPAALREAAEFYAGCVSGALEADHYLHLLQLSGFTEIEVRQEKAIHLPKELLERFLNPEDLLNFRKAQPVIFSSTVYGKKPLSDTK